MRATLLYVALCGALALTACNRPSDQTSISPAPSSPPPGASADAAPEVAPESSATAAVKDAAITGKVRAALAMADDLRDSALTVETVDGRVILGGKLPDQAQVDRAIETARTVEGVREVENRIAVSRG